jgi:hypothetical protein
MSLFILNLDHQNEEQEKLINNYGIKSYTEKTLKTHTHNFKSRIVDSGVLSKTGVNYVTLDKDSVHKGLHEKLKEQKILSFLRIDNKHLPSGIPEKINYEDEIRFAKNNGIVGIKVTFYIDNIDAIDMITNIANFYGNMARREKIIPILEFNVRKEFEDKSYREEELFKNLFNKLYYVLFDSIIIFSLPENKGVYDDINRYKRVKCVFGNDFEQEKSSYVENINGNKMEVSVKNTVLENLKVNLTDEQFARTLENNILHIKNNKEDVYFED